MAQRSYAATVARQLERDQARALLRPLTESDPLTSVLGADGTGIGKRSLMHVACSIAPSYRPSPPSHADEAIPGEAPRPARMTHEIDRDRDSIPMHEQLRHAPALATVMVSK